MKQSVTITGENLSVTVSNYSSSERPLSKAEQRIAALKARGIDVSCYFPLGSDQVVKIQDGAAVPVSMDDDTERRLVEGGYINHYTLFRRWVMAQMFRILRYMEQTGASFNATVQSRGYDYQWRMLDHELLAQAKMFRHGDKSNFTARNRWFHAETAAFMADDYVRQLRAYVDSRHLWRTDRKGCKRPKHTCKGIHYVRLGSRDIFVSDLEAKVYRPLRRQADAIDRADTPDALHAAVREFLRMIKPLPHPSTFKQAAAFIDAYKGSGAYFTMRNLILFHGARFSGRPSESQSLSHLEDKTREYGYQEGWRLLGVMKKLIASSGISVQTKLASLRSKA